MVQSISKAPNLALSLRTVFNALSMLSIAEFAPDDVAIEIWLIPVVDEDEDELVVVVEVTPSATPSPSASAAVLVSYA